ncbi:Ubiquitin carboxyl-terminal hydrolase isozyme L3 [Grifola frondosa]|uniref:Ubiquitin carboxyl-terminal hydrolase n=1 Tax=Grifola frondosa TaxID=5627 RepID=A0A1C7LNY8_GRIFR|nr:Ubiquitin carboxyl-terminal hydrolase isozyme L3 [Grifola frondosa]
MSPDGNIGRWIPLESNPEVLNEWANKAGLVVSQAQFQDIYGLDSELLAMVSQPVKAIILLFPISNESERRRKEEDAHITAEGQHAIDPTVFYVKQTISNACGTIALLHALVNSDVTFAPESALAKFIDECKDKSPEERAKILETTPLFADIHAETATSGQTSVPTNLHTDLHFTCFVQAPSPPSREEGTPVAPGDMRLVELDGRRVGPVDRGACADFLKDVAKFVKDNYVAHTASMHFSMIALGPPVS